MSYDSHVIACTQHITVILAAKTEADRRVVVAEEAERRAQEESRRKEWAAAAGACRLSASRQRAVPVV